MSEDHLTESLLQRGFRSGFDPETSRGLLLHLDGGCPSCSEAVRAFASRHEVDVAEAGALPDPVVLALRRWVGVLRQEPFPPMITPAHLFWVERLSFQPEAFCRVVIEEAFLTTLCNSDPGKCDILLKLVETLAGSRFEQIGEKRRSDLQALSHAFLAWTRRGDWLGLVEQMRLTEERLAAGSGDPEVCATACLHVSAAHVAVGVAADLFDKSAEVERHLLRLRKTTKCSGHMADLRIHQGTKLYRDHQLAAALEKLSEGLALIPAPWKWLRFFTVSKLARLGFRLDKPRLWERHLLEAERLAERFFGAEQGTVFLLRGQMEMAAGRFGISEAALHKAVDRFRQTGWRGRGETLEALRDLRTLYLRLDRAEEVASLRADLRALVQSDASPWRGKERDGLWRLAAELDDLPWLRRRFQTDEVVH